VRVDAALVSLLVPALSCAEEARMSETAPGALVARPHAPAGAPLPAGVHPLVADGRRRGLLVVPAPCRPDRPAALVVALHGAGGDAPGMVSLLAPLSRALPDAVWVVHESRGVTWDVIEDELGPDVARLDAALASVFDRCAIDPARIAITGFSDGASYALTLGLGNGALFPAVLAFSPGFEVTPERRGHPRVFISHGTRDRVLPIDRTSRRIAPRLEREGYEVSYREFDGPHAAPAAIQEDAAAWLGWAPAAKPRPAR
jgi:phospholipase/carboxylesterase